MAGMEHFKLVVKGRGGHTASPQSAIDPIITAAGIIQGVQTIQTREIDVLKEPTIIMFGRIQGGTASNVIPDTVTLEGTMRFLFEGDPASEDNPKKRFERFVSNICGAHRAAYELSFLYGHPTLVNHREMADLVNAVAARELDPAPEIVSPVSIDVGAGQTLCKDVHGPLTRMEGSSLPDLRGGNEEGDRPFSRSPVYNPIVKVRLTRLPPRPGGPK